MATPAVMQTDASHGEQAAPGSPRPRKWHRGSAVLTSDRALEDGPGVETTTRVRPDPQLSWARRTSRVVLSRSPWLVSAVLVLAGLRATWNVPLQGDDFWLLFSIHANDVGIWVNSVDFVSLWIANGTHFNPIGYLLDALLKGGMLASESSLVSPSVMHHGIITLCTLLTLVAASSLLRRLLVIAADVTISAAALSVPVALGFLASTQLTAPWANYDPLVSHPIYSSLTTLVGFAYLAAALRAVMSERSRRWTLAAAALGVAGFLIYEMFIVFVVALAGIVVLYRNRLATRHLRAATLWFVGAPLLSLVAARIFVASHETVTYAGTDMAIGLGSIPAVVVSTYTSAPGSLWGVSGGTVNMSLIGPFAVATALVAGTTFALWATALRRSASPVGVTPSLSGLRALWPVALIGVLSPMPFAVSEYWAQVLLGLGQSYMHSLIQLWCWAMAIALVMLEIARRRWSPAVIVAVALVLTVWIGIQVNVNRQLAAGLSANPRFAVDVTAALERRVPDSDALRCASLVPVEAAGMYDDWDRVLNREFEERYDEPYCSSSD